MSYDPKDNVEKAEHAAADASEKAKEAGQAAVDAVAHAATDIAEKARHGIGDLLHKAADKLAGK